MDYQKAKDRIFDQTFVITVASALLMIGAEAGYYYRNHVPVPPEQRKVMKLKNELLDLSEKINSSNPELSVATAQYLEKRREISAYVEQSGVKRTLEEYNAKVDHNMSVESGIAFIGLGFLTVINGYQVVRRYRIEKLEKESKQGA